METMIIVTHLNIHHPDADPYEITDLCTLEDAVTAEADTIASQAGSDLLAEPTEAERDVLRERVVAEALASLRTTGEYRDPLGVLWTLTGE